MNKNKNKKEKAMNKELYVDIEGMEELVIEITLEDFKEEYRELFENFTHNDRVKVGDIFAFNDDEGRFEGQHIYSGDDIFEAFKDIKEDYREYFITNKDKKILYYDLDTIYTIVRIKEESND